MFRLLIGLIGVLLLIAAVGCESEPDPTARPAPTTPPASTSTPRPAPTNTPESMMSTSGPTATPVVIVEEADPGELVVYSGRSESLVGPIIEQFAEATGIDVSVKYGSTSEVAATILEEGANTPADIFFAQDPGGLAAVESMFTTLPNDVLNLVSPNFRSPDGKWIGLSGRARVIVYNTRTVSPNELPADLRGFTDPKWQGRIGWPPTNGSFQAMVTAMRVIWGEDETRAWLEGILANNPQIYPKNTPTVAAAGAGEIDVGFVNHYYLYRFLAEEGEGFAARNAHLSGGGPGAMILVAGAGVLDDSANSENAIKFIEFMLSPVAQQYFAGSTYEYPLVEGVNVNRLLTPLDAINAPEVDMADLGDLEGTLDLLRDTGVLP